MIFVIMIYIYMYIIDRQDWIGLGRVGPDWTGRDGTRQMDGWMDGWIEGQIKIDRSIDRQMEARAQHRQKHRGQMNDGFVWKVLGIPKD